VVSRITYSWSAAAPIRGSNIAQVLRKSLFNPDLSARLLAVHCLFSLIDRSARAARAAPTRQRAWRREPVGDEELHLSQSSQAAAAGPDVALLAEVSGFLRRCLTQQYAVRAALYGEVSSLIERHPALHGCVPERSSCGAGLTQRRPLLDLLYPQLVRCYEPSPDALWPLRTEICADASGPPPWAPTLCSSAHVATGVSEPLPQLLAAVCRGLVVAGWGIPGCGRRRWLLAVFRA
jgi:hypothetical protein